jgi:1,5-anhydro-D-fructose reductase (1,5-anhydro-D-mannitol-forming)
MTQASEHQVLRWGLLGCGDVAQRKSGPAFNGAKGSALVAVASRDQQRAAAFADRYQVGRHYTKYESLLADPEVNAVYIATPPHVHLEQALAAFQAGKHVLCEKPMGLTLAECDKMIDAANTSGKQLMIAYYRRTYPAVVKIKELLDRGATGQVTKIRTEVADIYRGPATGTLPWRLDPKIAGGGFLWDVGCHRLDLMVHFAGEVAEVSAFLDATAFTIPVEDSATLVMRFKNGAQGTGIYHWNVQSGGDTIEIGGTKGRIHCDMASGQVDLFTAEGKQSWTLPPPAITHLGLVEDFVDAVQNNRPNCVDGAEGRKTNAILDAAVRSHEEKRTVAVA